MNPIDSPAAATKVSRRRFVQLGLGSAAALATAGRLDGQGPVRAPQPTAASQLDEASIAILQTAMGDGEQTAVSLAQAYLDRVEQIDRAGPTLRSILQLNPDALAVASDLDRERAEGQTRGPLHGIPVLVKDNLDSGDHMSTTAGSRALAAPSAPRDATVISRLRAAGCVLLGKANLSEWANFRSTRSSSGWSGLGGQTRNPYALDRNPCGSSSGSAVAVSANLCAAAIGTETDGSIVCPSNANGIVGIKPTLGLVSRAGIVPIAHSQDTAGPMARSVADASALLSAITGADARDPMAVPPEAMHADYTVFCRDGDLGGLRLGVARNYLGFHERVDSLVEEALGALRELGASVIDVELPHRGDYHDSEYQVLLYEFRDGLNRYLASRPNLGLRSLDDLIAYNEAHADIEMPFFRQEIFEEAQAKGTLEEPEYLEALTRNRQLSQAEGIDAVVADHGLDAVLAATGGPAWPTDPVTGDHFLGGCSQPAAVAGYPHVTVPMGFVFGLPVNLSIFGGAFTEPALIRIAHAFERTTRHRRPPRFLETVDLADV